MNKNLYILTIILVSFIFGFHTSAQILTPDLTPPLISSVTVTEITQFAATIKWTTNEQADGQIAFCTTYLPGCTNSTPLVADLTTAHVINLSGLTPGTYYYMFIKSKDSAGNLRTYYRTFRTLAGATVPTPTPTATPALDRIPPYIGFVTVSEITPFAATIRWTTNEPADGQLAFCTIYIVGCLEKTPLVPDLTLEHIINVSGLKPSTYYYMWIYSKDASGNTRTYFRTFRTLAGEPTPTPTPTPPFPTPIIPFPSPVPVNDVLPPVISSVTVTEITPFAATIKWTTNEPADGQIAFCTTYLPGCTNSTPLVADLTTAHVINLSGLTPNVTYYMWIKSKDAVGNLRTYYRTFRTTIAL